MLTQLQQGRALRTSGSVGSEPAQKDESVLFTYEVLGSSTQRLASRVLVAGAEGRVESYCLTETSVPAWGDERVL